MYIVLGKVLVTNDEKQVAEREVVLLASEDESYAEQWSQNLKMGYTDTDEIFETFGPDVVGTLECNEDGDYEGIEMLTILSTKVLSCPGIPTLDERVDNVVTALENGKVVPSHEIIALVQELIEKIVDR